MKNLIKTLLREELTNIKINVGCLIMCEETNNFFLLHRNDFDPSWALISGGVDDGEKPLDALKREIVEELSINPNIIDIQFVRKEIVPNRQNREFYYFKGITKIEFKPTLDHENLAYGWFSKDNLPNPLYPGLLTKINQFTI